MRPSTLPAVRACILIGAVGLLLGRAPKAEAQLLAVPPVDTVPAKDPATARWKAIFPGGGHWYAGEKWRAALVAGGMMVILVAGSAENEKDVPCYYDIPPERNCVTSSAGPITYAVAAGFLGLSIWDAGRAAERTNARRGRGASLLVQPRPGGASGHRVGFSIPLGGSRGRRD